MAYTRLSESCHDRLRYIKWIPEHREQFTIDEVDDQNTAVVTWHLLSKAQTLKTHFHTTDFEYIFLPVSTIL